MNEVGVNEFHSQFIFDGLFFFFNDEEPQIHPTVAGFASFVFIDVRSVDLLERDHYFPSHPCVQ